MLNRKRKEDVEFRIKNKRRFYCEFSNKTSWLMNKEKVFIITLLSIFLIGVYGCVNNSNSTSSSTSNVALKSDSAYLDIETAQYDFGKISRVDNPRLLINFKIRNNGERLLVISKVDVSCGCLSVRYPEKPIYPRQESQITVQVNTQKQMGIFNKTVFIRSNAVNDPSLLRIKGEIFK